MNTQELPKISFRSKSFLTALVINFIWINLSEVFRYLLFVMPMMREAFPGVIDIAPMNMQIFLIWGIWDCILVVAATGFTWLYLERFGYTVKHAVTAGTYFWLGVFVILWLGLLNMNLTTLDIITVALPLAWIEMVVAALIVNYSMQVQT